MKILHLLSSRLVIGLVIGLTGCVIINPSQVRGSGITKTEERTVSTFDSLDVNYAGSIEVRSQEKQSVEISGDDNIIPFITTEVKNGTLYIQSSKGYSPRQNLKIRISTPNIKRFILDGVGEAKLSNIKNDRIEIDIHGVGSFRASGETKDANIKLSGVGNINAKNLRAVNAIVNSDAVGTIDLYVTGQLDVNTSGIGEVNYYGNPKIVNKQMEGIGKINQK